MNQHGSGEGIEGVGGGRSLTFYDDKNGEDPHFL